MDVDLACIGPTEASACVDFLLSKGIDDVVQYGAHVHTSITAQSVTRLAREAVAYGWATRSAATQVLAKMDADLAAVARLRSAA